MFRINRFRTESVRCKESWLAGVKPHSEAANSGEHRAMCGEHCAMRKTSDIEGRANHGDTSRDVEAVMSPGLLVPQPANAQTNVPRDARQKRHRNRETHLVKRPLATESGARKRNQPQNPKKPTFTTSR